METLVAPPSYLFFIHGQHCQCDKTITHKTLLNKYIDDKTLFLFDLITSMYYYKVI